MAYRRRYRRKSSASAIIGDVAYIGSKLGWQGCLVLGFISFTVLYFIFPLWLSSILQEQKDNMFYPLLEAIFARRLHWFEWVGIATGVVSVYFALRNYLYENRAQWQERSFVGFLAKIISRSID